MHAHTCTRTHTRTQTHACCPMRSLFLVLARHDCLQRHFFTLTPTPVTHTERCNASPFAPRHCCYLFTNSTKTARNILSLVPRGRRSKLARTAPRPSAGTDAALLSGVQKAPLHVSQPCTAHPHAHSPDFYEDAMILHRKPSPTKHLHLVSLFLHFPAPICF